MKDPRTMRLVLVAMAVGACMPALAVADVVSDQAAALLVYPRVIAGRFGDFSGESVIQLTNTSNQEQRVHCFYVNAGGRCSLSENFCDPVERPCEAAEGFCVPQWVETDFDIVITPRQPLAWRVSEGLTGDDLPLTGAISGPGNSTNVGTSIPPVTEPFLGELKCIVVDGTHHAVPSNVLIGNSTLISEVVEKDQTGQGGAAQSLEADVDKHNAIGIEAINGDADQDNVLVLGGGAGEYNGCPAVLIVNHIFDFA